MSRTCDISLVSQLAAAERWKQRCWVQQLSLFAEDKLWTSENFDGLKHHFVDAPDTGGSGFLPTLARQLKDAPPAVQRLATEVVWLLYVFPRRSIGPDKKRGNLRAIAAIGGLALPAEHWALQDEALQGIGSTGTFYNTGLWIEFAFSVLVFQRLFALPDAQRVALADPSSALAAWLDELDLPATLPGGQPINREGRQFRHIFLFLMQPDRYERISSSQHKRDIVKALAPQIGMTADLSSAQSMDAQLLAIRRHLEAKADPTDALDFYRPPLKAMWQNDDIEPETDTLAADDRNYWLVGAYWDDDEVPDQTATFVAEGRWQNGYEDKFLDAVNRVKVGDSIAIKTTFVQKLNLPFDGQGKSISCMRIKARGVVTANPGDGRNLSVDWEPGFQSVVIYSYTYRATIAPINHAEHPQVVRWIFEDVPQPLPPGGQASLAVPLLAMEPQPAPAPALDQPRNVIFFGPPGTGKTHTLLTQVLPAYTDQAQLETPQERMERVAAELSWFEVVGATLIELAQPIASVPQIRLHPFVQAKLATSQSKLNLLPRLWGVLQSHTVEASTTVKTAARVEPLVFDKTANSGWQLVGNWQSTAPELQEARQALAAPSAGGASVVKRYEWVTFHPSYSYEDFVEGLRPAQRDPDDAASSFEIRPEDGALKRICDRARRDPSRRYALVIDEINRGNIAKIFGELITLVEDDKRAVLGPNGELKSGIQLTLPYSRELFGVPANVDFYGTMNTSDRSIALVDLALRRRFVFREVEPAAHLLGGSDGEGQIDSDDGEAPINLRKVLRVINARLTVLRGRDARLGHAYLSKVKDIADLREAFAERIIPLLQEHFFEDWGQIGKVLAVSTGTPPFLAGSKPKVSALFFRTNDELTELADMPLWHVSSALPAASFRGLYEGITDSVLDLI